MTPGRRGREAIRVVRVVCLALVGAAWGCDRASAPADESPPADVSPPADGSYADTITSRTQYRCDGVHIEAAMLDSGGARVTLPGRDVVLPSAVAASGTRYAEGGVEFWSHGMEDARLTLEDGETTACTAIPGRLVWAEARDRGVRIRVGGNEPGWYAEVEDGDSASLHLVLDYGDRELHFSTSSPLATDAGVRAVAEGDTATLRVMTEPCTDSMSGWSFPLDAELTVNDRVYRGCGRSY